MADFSTLVKEATVVSPDRGMKFRGFDMQSSTVGVVVANYNGGHLLADCLGSLKDQDIGNIDIIVVDNASTDDSESVASLYGVRFYRLDSNRGLSVAYNTGARLSKGDYIFFVNNDMRFARDCIRSLVRVANRDDRIFAVDPLAYDWAGKQIIHAGTLLKKGNFIRYHIPIPGVGFNPVAVPDEEIEVPWGCAGSLLVSREKFEKLGGFDETFFIDVEDLDLCWRAWMCGWVTIFQPTAKLWHRVGVSSQVFLHQVKGARIKRSIGAFHNYQRFVIKTMSFKSVFLMIIQQLLLMIAFFLLGKFTRGIGVIGAFWLNLCSLPATIKERKRVIGMSSTTSKAILNKFLELGENFQSDKL